MKKIFILLFSFVLMVYNGFSQIQATLKPGSQPNSVYVTIKSTVALTGVRISTFQFAIGVPTVLSTGITANIVASDPLINYSPLSSTETQNAISYKVFGFSGDGVGALTNFTAGGEINYAEVFFSGANSTLTDVRIMQLINGGSNGQVNFYVANAGTDITNQVAQFYASLPANVINDGLGYLGSSWARLGTSLIILPVKFNGFTAVKKNNDAILNWTVENESAITDRYEVERSFNGVNFNKFTTVTSRYTGNTTNNYSLTDYKLTSLNSNGIIYYRITQVDKDGKSANSAIKSVKLDDRQFTASVYPNPVVSECSVNLDLVNDAKINIVISDAIGKQVQSLSFDGVKGLNTYTLNMKTLAKGTYMVKVMAGTQMKTFPVIKK